ncbi:MAG: AI-2E family transporter [Gaiellales bacterium]
MRPDPPRKIEIPRWIQLVGLPLILVGAWQLVSAVSHAVFVFVVAGLIAILLNPIVRAFCSLRIPRPLAVALVYICFAIAFGGLSALAGTVVADQVRSVSATVESELTLKPGQTVTPAEHKVDRLQVWLNDHGLRQIHIKQLGNQALDSIRSTDVQTASGRIVDIAQGLLIGIFESLFNVVLVIVISVYMLLDAPRLAHFLRRLFPGTTTKDDLVTRTERALIAYVRGQILVCAVIGATAGVGLWLLGVVGIFPGGSSYALAFGAFAAVTEVIPYVGPWIGATVPFVVALIHSPTAALAVAVLFLFIHQIEGHVVIPKLMGSAVRVHPLVVIFALLAGGELYGLAGILVTLPLVAVGREVGAFLFERIGLESWRGAPVPVEVPVEVDHPVEEPAATVAGER